MGLLDGILPLNDHGDGNAAAALADTTVLCLVRAGIGDDHTHNTASDRTRLALKRFLARDTLYDGAHTSLLLVLRILPLRFLWTKTENPAFHIYIENMKNHPRLAH